MTRQLSGMKSNKTKPPVSTLLHIRIPNMSDHAWCRGRALTGGFWPAKSTPTKDGSCPRCWGRHVAQKTEKNLLRVEVGPHTFAFGRSKQHRQCTVCDFEQEWKFCSSRSGWHWMPVAPAVCEIMTECDECRGTGRMQATCSGCGTVLTTENQSTEDPEGACKDCAQKDGSE